MIRGETDYTVDSIASNVKFLKSPGFRGPVQGCTEQSEVSPQRASPAPTESPGCTSALPLVCQMQRS